MTIGIDLTIFRTYQGTEVFTENIIGALARIGSGHKIIIYKGSQQFLELDKLSETVSDRVRVVNFYRLRNSAGVIFTQQVLMPFYAAVHRVNVLYSPSPFFSFWHHAARSTLFMMQLTSALRNLEICFPGPTSSSVSCSAQCVKRIITVSDFSKQELVSQYGFDPYKVAVVKEAVPHLPHVDTSEDSPVLAKFKLKPKAYLFYVGSLNPRKNIAGMIQGLRRICQVPSRI
ncbi:hypothetical protein IPM19_04165 [bacterium]|nr:MAG: hypothetical protein IPM19_04165 [bacterium]